MRIAPNDAVEGRLTYALAGFLLLAGPVWHALYSGEYPFTRAEAIVLPLASGGVGAALALIARRLGRHLGSVVFGAMLFTFADLQFDPQRLTYTAVVVAACVAASALLWRFRATIASIALVTLYVATLVTLPQAHAAHSAPPPQGVARPVLLHIILDEQSGVGGLLASGDTATAGFLRTFYLSRGFRLFEGAYSRYRTTEESIPSTLALGSAPVMQVSRRPTREGQRWRRLMTVPYFRALAERGYQVHVFGNTFIDYCSAPDAPVATCVVEEHNSVRNIGTLEGPTARRAMWTLRYLLNTRSHVYSRLHRDPDVWRFAVAGGGLEGARQLLAAIEGGVRPGTAFFAHFLAPHQPADVDAECRLLPGDARVNYPGLDDDARRRRALSTLGGQTRCVHRVVGEILDALDRRVGREGAIVVIHGDHGYRLDGAGVRDEPLSDFSPGELVSGFPTLFAFRGPGVVAASTREAVPTQDLFWTLFRRDFVAPAGEALPAWQHAVRRFPRKGSAHDTIRVLSNDEMPWAQPR